MPACQLLKRGDGKGRAGRLAEIERRDAARDVSKRRLLCRRCGSPITTQADGIAVDGHHVHRTNPAGIAFEFGCFASAPGAEIAGEPTSEFSWFAGYRWCYSLCSSCASHLGWYFEGTGPSFHGLILDRLVREDVPRTFH